MSARFAVTLLIVASCPVLRGNAAQEAPLEWQASDGPYTGAVHDFAVARSGTVFAITRHGLRRSLDAGVNWSECGGASGTFVRILPDGRLIVGPSPGGELYYLDESCRALGSVTLPPDFNSPKTIDAIAISSSGRLVASRWGIGLFLSDDSGRTWRAGAMPSPKNAWVLSIVATGPRHLVAATTAQVLRSRDDGETWTPTGSSVAPTRLALDSTGAVVGGASDGVWRSVDEGSSWTRAGLDGRQVWTLSTTATGTAGRHRWVAAVLPRFAHEQVVLLSENGGASWSPVASPIRDRVHALTSVRDAVIAGAADGFFRAANPMADWTFHGVLLAPLRMLAAAGRCVVAGGPAAWRSADGGQTWEPIVVYLQDGGRAPHLSLTPTLVAFLRDGQLLVGTQNGVAVSPDRGSTWRRSGLWKLAYSVAELPDGAVLAGTMDGVFRSSDRGTTWIERSIGLSNFDVRYLTVLDSGELFAATRVSIHRSTDGADLWRPAAAGLPRLARPAVLASGRAAVAVAGVGTEIYVFDAASETWKVQAATASPVTSLAWDPGGRLWIGTASTGVSIMQHRGSTWTSAPAGLAAEAVHALAISDTHVMAATERGTFLAVRPAAK